MIHQTKKPDPSDGTYPRRETWAMPETPWRQVLAVDHWWGKTRGLAKFRSGSQVLTLECGHTKRLKMSQEPPKRMLCSDCDNLLRGSSGTRFDCECGLAFDESAEGRTIVRVVRVMTEDERKKWCR